MTTEINIQSVPLIQKEVTAENEQQQFIEDGPTPIIDPVLQPFDHDQTECNAEILKQNENCSDLPVKPNGILSKFHRFTIFLQRFSGIFYAVLSSFLFSTTNFIIKQLTMNLMDAMFFRFLGQTLIALIVNIHHGYNPFHIGTCKETLLYLANALVGTSNSLFFYLSLSLIPLPDLNTMRYSSVIWTAVIAVIVFRESKLSIPTILAIILTVIGVVCVVQPTFLFSNQQPAAQNTKLTYLTTVTINSRERYIGLLLAILCAFSISSNIIITKKLFNLYQAKQSVLMFQFSFLTTIAILITQICRRIASNKYDVEHFITIKFILASIVGVLQILPVLCYQKAIKREHPSIVTVAQSSDILFSIVLQNLFTNSKSNWLALLGAALVLTSIALIGGQKFYQDRRERLAAVNCNEKIAQK